MSKIDLLKNLPAVDEVLRLDALSGLLDRYARPQLVNWVRHAIADCRSQILGGEELTEATLLQHVIARVALRIGRVAHPRVVEFAVMQKRLELLG